MARSQLRPRMREALFEMSEAAAVAGGGGGRGACAEGGPAAASEPGAPLRLGSDEKRRAAELLRRSDLKAWAGARGRALRPPRLHPAILRTVREWFDLVDYDGSGTLEYEELAAALQAAQIPADATSISEMIRLMDANHDGCIGWNEFEAFMMEEFAAGKQLLSGEYLLPSGTTLPFGAMIGTLKRGQVLGDVVAGGEARSKWAAFTGDLGAASREMAEAEAQLLARRGAAAAAEAAPPVNALNEGALSWRVSHTQQQCPVSSGPHGGGAAPVPRLPLALLRAAPGGGAAAPASVLASGRARYRDPAAQEARDCIVGQ
ncbi:MAG: hypothetical protein J3K34DRAFT_500515 [Monoraphidium minutum]|nr:MAG: hypothetical protein J3K34DRAFT_500515 [Monoraphidium minutum]